MSLGPRRFDNVSKERVEKLLAEAAVLRQAIAAHLERLEELQARVPVLRERTDRCLEEAELELRRYRTATRA